MLTTTLRALRLLKETSLMKEINFSKQQFKLKLLENMHNVIFIGFLLGSERPYVRSIYILCPGGKQ